MSDPDSDWDFLIIKANTDNIKSYKNYTKMTPEICYAQFLLSNI